MEDLENGLDEKGLIDFVKTVLLSGDNPRGKEAHKNLEWGIRQYRKQLILHGVVRQSEQLKCQECSSGNLIVAHNMCAECLADDW